MPAPLRLTRLFVLVILLTSALAAAPSPLAAQAAQAAQAAPIAAPAPRADTPARAVLAIGAHAGDMELTTGAVLAKAHAGGAPHRGVRGVWYAENWEDPEGFTPFVYMDVSSAFETWRAAVTQYAFVRGGISSFAYLDFYTGLATMRGALARARYAVAFDIESWGKRRVVAEIP